MNNKGFAPIGIIVLVVVVIGLGTYFAVKKSPEEIQSTVEPDMIAESLNFKLNAKTEEENGDWGQRTRVTYSTAVAGVLSRGSGDWTLELLCPQGVVIHSVAGEQKCPTHQLRASSTPTLSFAFMNKTNVTQSVVATARLLSKKDNQTPIATAKITVKVPAKSQRESVTKPANLTQYRNDQYGFEFRYPSTWRQCDMQVLQHYRLKTGENENHLLQICFYVPSSQGESLKSVAIFIDNSGQYGTFGDLRNRLQSDSKRATEFGLYSIFSEKNTSGRTYLHVLTGDVGTSGTYYTLLDAKTNQKTYLILKDTNAKSEVESILLPSLKTKEDNLNF